MGVVEEEVVIAASPARVFAFLAPHLVGAWYAPDNSTRVELLGGEMRVGARLRVRGESRFGSSSYEVVVTAWDPPRTFAWRSERGAPPQEVELRLEPEGAATRLRWTDRYRARGPWGVRDLLDFLLLRARVAAIDREAVENLKALAEGRRGCA